MKDDYGPPLDDDFEDFPLGEVFPSLKLNYDPNAPLEDLNNVFSGENVAEEGEETLRNYDLPDCDQ